MSRALRTFFIWVPIAVLLFLGAIALTFLISRVHGRPPFLRSASSDSRVQVISISLNPETKDLAQGILVKYGIGNGPRMGKFDSEKYPFLNMRLPFDVDVKILISNLKDATSCSSPRSATESSIEAAGDEPVHHLKITEVGLEERFGSPLYVLTPEPAAEDYFVQCFLTPVAETETFTTRRINFYFFVFPKDGPERQLMGNELQKSGLQNYVPIRSLILDLGNLVDVEDLRFEGGFQEQQWAGFESMRVIPPDGFVVAVWKEVRREQTRDILLVVIGAFIALGATTVIEGFRPLIDGWIEGHNSN